MKKWAQLCPIEREPRPAVGGVGARCAKRYNCNTPNQAAARELGKAELSDRAGVMQPLPPKVSTIVDTEPQARWSPTSRFN